MTHDYYKSFINVYKNILFKYSEQYFFEPVERRNTQHYIVGVKQEGYIYPNSLDYMNAYLKQLEINLANNNKNYLLNDNTTNFPDFLTLSDRVNLLLQDKSKLNIEQFHQLADQFIFQQNPDISLKQILPLIYHLDDGLHYKEHCKKTIHLFNLTPVCNDSNLFDNCLSCIKMFKFSSVEDFHTIFAQYVNNHHHLIDSQYIKDSIHTIVTLNCTPDKYLPFRDYFPDDFIKPTAINPNSNDSLAMTISENHISQFSINLFDLHVSYPFIKRITSAEKALNIISLLNNPELLPINYVGVVRHDADKFYFMVESNNQEKAPVEKIIHYFSLLLHESQTYESEDDSFNMNNHLSKILLNLTLEEKLSSKNDNLKKTKI